VDAAGARQGVVREWEELGMSTVLDELSRQHREIVTELLTERAPGLLAALHAQERPTPAQQEAVLDVLVAAFADHLGPEDEPTPRGVVIDDALGAFLMRWPAEDLTDR
jgi:hypothetical protein